MELLPRCRTSDFYCNNPSTMLTINSSNGQLKEYLTSGISKADFIQRVQVALHDGRDIPTQVATGSISTSSAANDSNQSGPSTSSQNPVPAEQEQPRSMTKKGKQEAAESAERAAKAAPGEGLEAADPEVSKKAADMKYALMQKKRQQDAQNERARILKRVEADKEERRAKEALRKEEARAAMESNDSQASTGTQPMSSNLRGPLQDQSDCALQVRLFDGTTIRSRFSPHNTLRKEVRQWVDAHREDGDIPYTFKQILTPLPNKTITVSEEEESLQSLGLNPSATLILIPVKDYTSAYEGGATGYISRGISAGVGLVSSGIHMVAGTLSSFLGGPPTPGGQVEHETGASPAPATANVRTLRDQGGIVEGSQFYNGNTVSLPSPSLNARLSGTNINNLQLNFEPRRDDDDKQD